MLHLTFTLSFEEEHWLADAGYFNHFISYEMLFVYTAINSEMMLRKCQYYTTTSLQLYTSLSDLKQLMYTGFYSPPLCNALQCILQCRAL